MRLLFVLAVLVTAGNSYAQKNKPLADTLARLVINDQKAAGLPPEGIEFTSPEWTHYKDSVFTSHYFWLKGLFARTGYPGIDMVGKQGAKDFWLLVQHLDKWPEFQEQVLNSMKAEVLRNNASAVDFAFLTDRVRLNTKRKQLYGTQVTYNTDSCQAIPKPLEEPATVNTRRKSVGLNPIEEYLNIMSESHFIMNKDMYEGKGIKGPKLYGVKE